MVGPDWEDKVEEDANVLPVDILKSSKLKANH